MKHVIRDLSVSNVHSKLENTNNTAK